MKATYQFSLSKELVPELHPCPNCGGKAKVYFKNDHADPSTAKPFVFIQCPFCSHSLSSADFLCDLSSMPALDKYSRIVSLWNQRALTLLF